MAVDPTTGEVIDPEGGVEDLKNQVISLSKYVEELSDRGAEARSMLRLFKFQSRWGWDIDERTERIIKNFVDKGHSFSRVSRHNLQKIWEAIKEGPYRKKAIENVKRLGLYDLLLSYEEKMNKDSDDPKSKSFGKNKVNFQKEEAYDYIEEGEGLKTPAGMFHPKKFREGMESWAGDHHAYVLRAFSEGRKVKIRKGSDTYVMTPTRTGRVLFKSPIEEVVLDDEREIEYALEKIKHSGTMTSDIQIKIGGKVYDPKSTTAFRGHLFESLIAGTEEEAFKSTYKIIERIKQCGNKAYIVGGAVRDKIMGKPCNDFDIITDMSNGFIEKKIGPIRGSMWRNGHEVLVVQYEGEEFDISRIPRTSSLIKELEERDLTMNAIAWDPVDDEYIDPTGGREDIQNKVLAFTPFNAGLVKNGQQPTRVLRCLRFYATSGFKISKETMDALESFAMKVKGNFGIRSKNNFMNNWEKMKKGKNFNNALQLLKDLELYDYCVEEFGIEELSPLKEGLNDRLVPWKNTNREPQIGNKFSPAVYKSVGIKLDRRRKLDEVEPASIFMNPGLYAFVYDTDTPHSSNPIMRLVINPIGDEDILVFTAGDPKMTAYKQMFKEKELLEKADLYDIKFKKSYCYYDDDLSRAKLFNNRSSYCLYSNSEEAIAFSKNLSKDPTLEDRLYMGKSSFSKKDVLTSTLDLTILRDVPIVEDPECLEIEEEGYTKKELNDAMAEVDRFLAEGK
jgi:tRNA nucleotidyltransferase/poly(A) polymerase